MAEEEVVILEADPSTPTEEGFAPIEEEASEETASAENAEDELAKHAKKRLLILLVAAGVLLLAIIIAIIVILKLKSHPTPSPAPIVKHEEKPIVKEQFSPSRVDSMIKKAHVLYEQGNKDEALKLYEKIATYNEAISYYNIGVAKLKEQSYAEALDAFKKAIQNQEHRCISAINAAVCALEMGDATLFHYYVDLAYAYLPEESNAPLYSYYVGLVHYYKNFYVEALSALSHPTNDFYREDQNYLTSKILASLAYNQEAYKDLEGVAKESDLFTLGLLQAKLGDYGKAKNYLVRALRNEPENTHVKMALALVENKLGNLANTASLIQEVAKVRDENAAPIYKMHAILKPTLFDVDKAQSEFEKELFFDNENIYSLLFYYAPYKVFDAKQTIDYIRKGSMNIFIDEIGPALSYLKASSTISKVNIAISKGIKKALDFHVYEANELFLKMVDEYKNHSILHYNLALTYAQMGDYGAAYRHFSKSYHLDNGNYLAGVFALMSGNLIGKDITKLSEDVKESITKNPTLGQDSLYASMIYLTDGNHFSLTRWIEQEKEDSPLHLVLNIVASQKLGNNRLYRLNAQKLQALLPKDILANIILFNIKHDKQDIKQYAKAIQIEFNALPLDYDAFYYGPKIVKEQYIKLLQIGGLLHQKRDFVVKRMEEERVDIPSIMQTLAYLQIYTNNFEEAFVLYNKLIDDFHKKDTYTVFLASVSAIGAGHSENAIALLELSKLTDPSNVESKYALGLLYQEVGNYEAATAQYRSIGNIGFISQYFTFELVK
ncbi:tetratricopeptide repeat protein [Sulfurospirillum cavolei]|uniref:tetratricopeptide repeat protein n=1 Tax=Sulfurospirillum cavolei TaxID=366522 RepID=UPI000764CEAA|nr:tetratricopeptide repeat protein [Sulfurospirillum cavolei]